MEPTYAATVYVRRRLCYCYGYTLNTHQVPTTVIMYHSICMVAGFAFSVAKLSIRKTEGREYLHKKEHAQSHLEDVYKPVLPTALRCRRLQESTS